MGETLYSFDSLCIMAADAEHTQQNIKAKELAMGYLKEVILEKNGVEINSCVDTDAENIIASFLRMELENGTHYLFNQRGGFEKTITTTILAEVKAFIEQENQTRGGNMTPEECFTMAVCFFKGVQSQQKHGWREVTETDLSKILSEVVAVPAKKRGR